MKTYTNANVTDIPEGYFWIKVDYLEGWRPGQVYNLAPGLISINIDDCNTLLINTDGREAVEAKFELHGPIPNPDQQPDIPYDNLAVLYSNAKFRADSFAAEAAMLRANRDPDRYRDLLERRVKGLEAMLTAFVQQAKGDTCGEFIDRDLFKRGADYLEGHGSL